MTNSIWFSRRPARLEDVISKDTLRVQAPYRLAALVRLDIDNFTNFITDFEVDRWYLEHLSQASYVDANGVWRCIGIATPCFRKIVLVMLDKRSRPAWIGYAHIGGISAG